ncbi:MAG: RHS repeat domain-containing protein [Kiritimatiellia bacterium]|jgi:RHS repeat-associated protein
MKYNSFITKPAFVLVGVVTFGYNARSEVTAASVQSNAFTYAYDHIGNHTASSVDSDTTTYTANNLNQYTFFSNLVQSCNPVYDLDGNMLTNDVWSYTWDCENRLVSVSSNNVCVVSNAYDHMSRRVLKWTPSYTTTFVYDGWLPILEIVASASEVATNAYIWGKDLSGSLQGAGGVGGLLAVWMNETWHFPFYDNNGNITAYVNEQGVIVAEYVYDAYGGAIAASGSMSDTFRHRFSTKYYDTEIGLYYYGYRFYSPSIHRWLNRDPIEEEGGRNLYAFCGNDGVNQWDFLGMNRMLTGSLMFVKGKSVRQEGFEKAREIIRLVENLNLLRTKNGQRRYDAQIKDLVVTPLEAVKKEVESNADNIYIVAHGGLQINGMGWGQYTYYWNKRDKVVEGIDIRYDGTLTPLSSFGPLKPSNIFGCYLSPRVRRVKRPFASSYSCKDTYNAMFGALYDKLLEYKTRPEDPSDCYPVQIRIYEGERADVYTSIGTEEALRRFPVKPEREYGIEEEEW